MTSLGELYDTYLRPLNLTWGLTGASRRRIMLASAFPALIIVAEVVYGVLSYALSLAEIYGQVSSEPWHRIYTAAYHLRLLS